MINPTLRRKALIIHNHGTKSKYLHGVDHDVQNIPQFLKSDFGGAWEDYEITIAPNNCSVKWLEDFFMQHNGIVDYYLLFFVGHGSYDPSIGPIYWLSEEENISNLWLKRQVADTPTMLITDSCYVIEKLQQGGIMESRTFSSQSAQNHRVKCKKAYNDQLRKLPRRSFTTASSVMPGEEAGENSEKGGYYIISLLEACHEIIKSDDAENAVYGIGFIHYIASKTVNQLSKGQQTPYLEGYTRTSQPPFLVKL